VPVIERLDVSLHNATQRTLPGLLEFTFDVLIEIRSPVQTHELERYIKGPFDTQAEQNSFVGFLRLSPCPEFQSVNAVSVELPRDTTQNESRRANIGLISGLVVASFASIMIGAIFIIGRARRRPRDRGAHSNLSPLANELTGDNDYMSEIGVNTVQNVSSLGDPIPMGLPNNGLVDASTLDSKSIDYDYQVAYEGGGPGASEHSVSQAGSSGGGTTPATLLADDETLDAQYVAEEQYEVLAPAGVLGLILETNMDGVPCINNVKPSSILIDQVQVGDKLLSVDDQDVTVMLASGVSKLIASKKDQPVRRLVFLRTIRSSTALDAVPDYPQYEDE